MTNLLGYLEETIKTYADKTAFAGENGSMTFGSIYEQARRIGSFLAEKEVRRKPVIVYMQKSPEEITAFLGVLYAGDIMFRWTKRCLRKEERISSG